MLYNLNLGIRNGGGIGDVMKIPNYHEMRYKDFMGYSLYQITYFILINMIIFGIFTGLIIDGFAAIREKHHILSEFFTFQKMGSDCDLEHF